MILAAMNTLENAGRRFSFPELRIISILNHISTSHTPEPKLRPSKRTSAQKMNIKPIAEVL